MNLFIVLIASIACTNILQSRLLELAWWSSEDALLAGGPWWRKSEDLLYVLADWHRAQDVKENEGTVLEVAALKISMGQALDPRDGHKRQAGDDFSVEDGVEHGEQGGESEAGEEPARNLKFRFRRNCQITGRLTWISFSRATNPGCCSSNVPHPARFSSSAACPMPHPAPPSSSRLQIEDFELKDKR